MLAVAKPRTASVHLLAKVGMRAVSPSVTLFMARGEAGLLLANGKRAFSMRLKSSFGWSWWRPIPYPSPRRSG